MKNLSSLRMNGLRSLNDDMLRSIIGGLQRPADDPRSGPIICHVDLEEIVIKPNSWNDYAFSYMPALSFKEWITDGGCPIIINPLNDNKSFDRGSLYSGGSPQIESSVDFNKAEMQNIPTTETLALAILSNKNIQLANAHESLHIDQGYAIQNIIDTSKGLLAHTSNYDNAPNVTVALSNELLVGILKLAETYKICISEVAGGSHADKSPHYIGYCTDINIINGQHVDLNNMTDNEIIAFRNAAYAAGAKKVLDPLNEPKHHFNHIHIQWK